MKLRIALFVTALFFFIVPTSHTIAQGETCATAVNVTPLPFSYSGTSCGSGFDYTISGSEMENPNLCFYPDPPLPGQNTFIQGEDFVFEFTPTLSSCYLFGLNTAPNGTLHLFETCPDDPLVTCLGYRRNTMGAPFEINATIESGNTIYIVVTGSTSWCDNFTLTVEELPSGPQENDLCYNAIDLQTTGSNIGATDCGEPDDWAPENNPAVDCQGDSGGWSSNENGVWFGVTIDASSPQPFSITIDNVSCVGGGDLLQMGLWDDIGTCTLSDATLQGCAIGVGTVVLGPLNLPLGDYHLYVDGQNGSNCEWEFESELLCNPAVMIMAVTTSTTCNGVADGSIDLTVSGGMPEYTYTWSGPTDIGDEQNPTGLAAGTYIVTVDDVSSCSATATIIINDGPSPLISATPIDETCIGSLNGEIMVMASGGTPPLNYTIDDVSTTVPITGLSAGTYNVAVIDLNGCSTEVEVIVETGPSPNLEINPTNESCLEAMDGEIIVSGSGGSPPLMYTIDGMSTTVPITGLSAGSYAIGVSDLNGCTAEALVIIEAGESPMITASATDESCSDAMDGEISVDGSGGMPPLTYTIDNVDTSVPILGLGAGTYTIGVSDLNGCAAEITVTVNAGSTPSMLLTAEDETCAGSFDGTIIVEGSGGTPPYNFTIDNVSTTIPISGLAAGTYIIGVTDENACSTEETITVGGGESPMITAESIDESCSGAMDGSITVEASGGTSPYFYTLNGTSTAIPITGLSAGTYTIGVLDLNGCTDEIVVTIDAPDPLVVTCSSTGESVPGSSDGSAFLDISGGSAFYDISWSGPSSGLSLDEDAGPFLISDLAPGNYTVLVTDENGCLSQCFFIIQPANCNASAIASIAVQISCFGDCNAEISLTIFDAVLPLSFDWTGPTDIGNQQNPTDLCPGDYSVVITDNEGCEFSTNISIAEPDELSIVCSSDSETEPGAADGTATIDISGGTLFYDISWNGPTSGFALEEGGTPFEINNLLPGTYMVIVLDDFGCEASCSFIVEHAACNAFASASLANSILCFGACTGAINLIISDAEMPLSFEWTGPVDIGNEQNPTDLCAGDYNVLITDNNGCEFTAGIGIDQPEELIISCSETGETAPNESDGTVLINIEGGTPMYDIDWSGPSSGSAIDQSAGGFMITDLSDGNYSVNVTDDHGCTSTCFFNIQSADCIGTVEAILVDSINCYGGCDAVINLIISDAAGPLNFVWTGPSAIGNEQNPSGLCAGDYSVVITDNDGCELSSSLSVDEPVELIISCSATDETTPGASNGTFTIEIEGGTALYDISWIGPESGNAINNTAIPFTIIDLPPGDYSIIVVDANGCIADCNFTIEAENCSGTVLASIANPVSCFEQCDAAITLIIDDVALPLSFLWTGPTSIDNEQNPIGLCAGDYDVIVTDGNGCTLSTSISILEGEDFPIAEAGSMRTLDCASAEVELDATGSSSGQSISYQWTTTNGNIISGNTDVNPIVNSEGLYTLIVTDDESGCISQDEVLVDYIDNAPQELLLEVLDPSCFGDTNGMFSITDVLGGTAPYLYSFNDLPFSDIDQFSDLPAGIYDVVTQDANGCEISTTLTITDPDLITIDVGENVTIQLGESTDLTAIFNIPASQIDSFIWLNAMTLNCEVCFDPIAQPTVTSTYSAIVYDLNGCFDIDEVTVFVENDRSIYIPNVFSPNDDGQNDFFTIFSSPGIKRINEFQIYNRWGENIFSRLDIQPNQPELAWDGSFKGESMNPGVYAYFAVIEFDNGEIKIFKGDVTLLR